MFNTILIPLDGSAFAEAALDYALGLARAFDSLLLLVRVVPHPQVVLSEYTFESADLFLELREAALKEAEEYLKTQASRLGDQGFNAHYQVVEGDNVAEWLLDVAADNQVDVIVMSTHGRSGLQRWVFGSIAEKIIRQAAVPVLLIRSTQAANPTVTEMPAATAALS